MKHEEENQPQVELPSGSTRSNIGGTRPSLLWPSAILALSNRLGVGAANHGENNFRLGQPYSVILDHALLHLFRWMAGDHTDDHLAAVGWAVCTLIEQEDRITRGELSADLDDLFFSPRRPRRPPQPAGPAGSYQLLCDAAWDVARHTRCELAEGHAGPHRHGHRIWAWR